MEEVRRDKAAEFDPSRESLVMVPLILDKARPVRANISIDAGTLEAIDEEAERRGLTRSSFLASAAMDKIQSGELNASLRHVDKRRTTPSATRTGPLAVGSKKAKRKVLRTFRKSSAENHKKSATGAHKSTMR